MCGIIGILGNFKHPEQQKKTLYPMLASLYHRGPDGWGTYISPQVALGHTRLSIIGLDDGNQPMANDRYVISYNGEIYNYIELKEELCAKGMTFKTHSDTEVFLKAFEYYGPDCFPMFNGQFAALIWDKQEKRLIIARDRFGIRPLYITNYDNRYYFASELKAFDQIEGYSRRFALNNLFIHALCWNTLSDETVFEDIRSLKSGSYEIFHADGRITYNRYYDVGETAGTRPRGFAGAKEEFNFYLEDAVKLRLRSDVPVGNYLSGGIDSSVITYLTSRHNKERFKTFSVGFEDTEFDESRYQHELLKTLNTEHADERISYDSISEHFFNALYHCERPIFRTAPIPLYLLSNRVHESDIKVVLTGEAADEILFGYDSFKELILLERWKKNPETTDINGLIKELYPHLTYYNDPRKLGLLKLYYEGFLDLYDNDLTGLNIRVNNNKIIGNFLHKDHAVDFNREALIEKMRADLPENYDRWSLLQKNSYLEIKTLLQGYLLSSQGDRMSMAHSVEGRYPFLDHRLVECVFNYPDRFKLHNFNQKFLLKECYNTAIPASIINRPKKPYTAPDLKSFVQNNRLKEQAAHFLSDQVIREYGIFNEKMVKRFVRKIENRGQADIGYRDNMTICFLLSTQMIQYQLLNKKEQHLRPDLKRVEIIDY